MTTPQRRPAQLPKAPDTHPARTQQAAPQPHIPSPTPIRENPNDPLVNYSARIPHSVRMRLNMYCARTERRSQTIVTEALSEWLERNDV